MDHSKIPCKDSNTGTKEAYAYAISLVVRLSVSDRDIFIRSPPMEMTVSEDELSADL